MFQKLKMEREHSTETSNGAITPKIGQEEEIGGSPWEEEIGGSPLEKEREEAAEEVCRLQELVEEGEVEVRGLNRIRNRI